MNFQVEGQCDVAFGSSSLNNDNERLARSGSWFSKGQCKCCGILQEWCIPW